MLDIKLIRKSPDFVRGNLRMRGDPEKIRLLNELIEYDKKWRISLAKLNKLRHEKNLVTAEIARLMREKKSISKQVDHGNHLALKIKEWNEKVKRYKKQTNDILMGLPNILHKTVPVGKDEKENVVVKVWGNPPKFNFEPKTHLEIALNLGLIDTERGAKVAGHGFYYLRGDLAKLDYAVMNYATDFLRKRNYLLIEPPFLMQKKPYLGVTDLEFFGDQLYKIENEDLYLIATSEHPLAAMFMNEVIDKKDLPSKFAGISPCFRKEVGTHGKYTKGLFRVHQFNKVEQFIFCLPDDSGRLHNELQVNSEDLYKNLGLHFRVVNVCTGDIGFIAAKKFDIEVWMADEAYRESGSNSNCTDYQARRLNIRFREKTGQAPAGFVHTLNNTALATSRTMMAILEQYQQRDGSIRIPEVLVPYMNGKDKIE